MCIRDRHIEKFFAWITAFWGRRIQICYPNFHGNKGGCYGNQIWAKISQNCTNFSSLQHIETLFACMVGFSGSANSNMLSEFSWSKGGCHGNQIWAKISQNCTDFSSVQHIEKFFAWITAFWGRRIQICYLNFQGTKGSCHDNQIWAKNAKIALISALYTISRHLLRVW